MAYTNSSLVSHTKISPNRTKGRSHAIDCITIHCVVGQCSVEALGNVFAQSSKRASSNYGVGYDGRIGMYVEEKDCSWCSSNTANDSRAITIEVASDTTHPYAVKDKALASLIELVTDICKRNNIKKLVWSTNKNDRINHKNGCNMTVHRDFANKSCPGDYLYNKHGYIADEVNKRLGVTTTTSDHKPTASTSLKFKVGDIVMFSGGKHYVSSNAVNGSEAKDGKAKVISVYKSGKHPYALRAVNDNGAFVRGVYGWVDIDTVSELKETTSTNTRMTPYVVQVVANKLNIRKGAGTNYGINGSIKDRGAYTIVDEAVGKGATKWGLLKSYEKSRDGWISLDYTKRI